MMCLSSDMICTLRQLDNGRYVCVREPLTQAHLEAHLRGDITLGTYLLDAESKGRFSCVGC